MWETPDSVKGCINDVSECRNNCRRNVLTEMRWNRIKRTSSMMTRKDEFRDFCLREWREVCEQIYVCWQDVFDRLWCGKLCSEVCNFITFYLLICE